MHPHSGSRAHGQWLWCLLALFVIRVVAQPLSLVVDAPYLPSFDRWHSGVLPYWVLVTAQACIVAVFAFLAWSLWASRAVPRRRLGIVLLWVGGTYFAGMLGRLVLGATMLGDTQWFPSPLPTAFHLVLASFLLVYGHFHARYGATP